jgi:hypothetical protein
MKRHFVSFFSPGTFVEEQTTMPIDSWDVDKAMAMARTIVERYNATPFAFEFSTRQRGAKQLDSHVVATSHRYYLGGEVLTLAQVKERPDLANNTLIHNMEVNQIGKIIVNDNSWRWVAPLMDGDVVLDFQPVKPIIEREDSYAIHEVCA